jgi:hypothetical protein
MTPAKPLLSMLDDLRVDAEERLAFTSDPEGYLASHGWADLDPGELREALGFAREAMSLDVAVTIPDGASLDDYVAAVEPLSDGDELDFDDFGADATPIDVEPEPPSIELDDRSDLEDDGEPFSLDLGPDDDLTTVDDDEDDDDPLDL